MRKIFRCCECYKVQSSSLSQHVLSKTVGFINLENYLHRFKPRKILGENESLCAY